MTPFAVLVGVAGAAKTVVAFFVLRAGFMQLGPGAEVLRRAFVLAGMMLLADAVLLLSLSMSVTNVRSAILLLWALGVSAWTMALALFLILRRRAHGETLHSGARNEN